MAKQTKKIVHAKTVRFEPGRVIAMTAIVSVLTLLFFGLLTAL